LQTTLSPIPISIIINPFLQPIRIITKLILFVTLIAKCFTSTFVINFGSLLIISDLRFIVLRKTRFEFFVREKKIEFGGLDVIEV